MTVTLKHFQSEDLETLWKVAFSDPKAEWHQWDGPYFNQEVPTLQELQENQANQTGFQWVANPFVSGGWILASLSMTRLIGEKVMGKMRWISGLIASSDSSTCRI